MKRSVSNVRPEKIDERKKEIDENDRCFFKKFGTLKKASVLLFYGRVNDAFDEIAKAANIIKEQKEHEKENEEKIKRRWRFKLGIESEIELPKPFDKVTLDDLTDDFLSKIDRQSYDISTIVLYIKNVCPQIREANDKNHFLNQLIEDLYLKTENIMVEKQKSIDKIKKNVEKLGDLAEIYEALGSDADKDPEAFIDNEGNPIKTRKKKKTMCDTIFKKHMYAAEGIEMKTEGKYYIKTLNERTFVQDPETQKQHCVLCPKGRDCPHAHNPIELDLIPISSNITNLQAIVKS
jgi:hypothetical protein